MAHIKTYSRYVIFSTYTANKLLFYLLKQTFCVCAMATPTMRRAYGRRSVWAFTFLFMLLWRYVGHIMCECSFIVFVVYRKLKKKAYLVRQFLREIINRIFVVVLCCYLKGSYVLYIKHS